MIYEPRAAKIEAEPVELAGVKLMVFALNGAAHVMAADAFITLLQLAPGGSPMSGVAGRMEAKDTDLLDWVETEVITMSAHPKGWEFTIAAKCGLKMRGAIDAATGIRARSGGGCRRVHTFERRFGVLEVGYTVITSTNRGNANYWPRYETFRCWAATAEYLGAGEE